MRFVNRIIERHPILMGMGEAVAMGTGDKAIEEKQKITWKELQTITDAWGKGLRKRLDDARGVAPKS